jgi:hypothetical protein
MTGFYRSFIPKYATIAAPLTKYLKGDADETFKLNYEALEAHAKLKQAVVSAPVLALPSKTGKYVLETDVSGAQLGVQLLQEQEDRSYRPLGYWSRQCNRAERNYSPTEREALAIVWGIRICRPYLERSKFVVRSDHQALRWLFSTSSTDGNPRILRWKLALSAFDFSVKYRPGASHKVPDELSRMATSGMSPMPHSEDGQDFLPCLVVPVEEDSPLLAPRVLPREGPMVHVPAPLEAISLSELLDAQASDEWCSSLLRQLETGQSPSRPPGLHLDEAGTLCCKPAADDALPPQWVVPAALREQVCTIHHFSKAAGHPGITKMTQTMSRHWYWPTLARDCAATVRRCPNCAAKRLKRGPKRSVPLTIFPPDRPLEFFSMDVLGPLPITARGNRFVLCLTDRFSKMSIAVPMANQTASTVAQALVDHWIAVFGIPLTILLTMALRLLVSSLVSLPTF